MNVAEDLVAALFLGPAEAEIGLAEGFFGSDALRRGLPARIRVQKNAARLDSVSFEIGAGRQNRTDATSLEDWSSTTKLYPLKK